MNVLVLHDDRKVLEWMESNMGNGHNWKFVKNVNSLTHPKLVDMLGKYKINLFIFRNPNVDTKLIHKVFPNLLLIRILERGFDISNDYNVYHYIHEPLEHSLLANLIGNCKYIFDLRLMNMELLGSLKASNQSLIEKNESLMKFAYITAHDLRTPLRSISGLAGRLEVEIGRDTLDFDKIKHIVSMISQSCEKMRTLIDDSLDYSIVSKNQDMHDVDMDMLLDRVLAEISIESNASIVRKSKLPIVYGSAVLLGRVLLNLVSNGFKFNTKECKVIELDTIELEKEVCISVRDNGIGIDMKYKNRIFDLFERIHTDYVGNGMGLAIVKEIVERHGGRIEMDSELDKYTEFRLYFPKTRICKND